MTNRLTLSILLGAALAAPSFAEAPKLVLPMDCALGQSCYIEDYVDLDPGPGQSDYACGLKSRDGHRGTDIALLSFDAMDRGVSVLAAAPGRVAATRDGMADIAVTEENRASIEGRECGNAVRVDHGDGWQTLYCHMKRGSVLVEEGDTVVAGTPLGEVGLSGLTNHPHVHFSVLHDGAEIDPFLPDREVGCGLDRGDGLWLDAPDYYRTGLFTAGFSDRVPDLAAVDSGAARITRTTSDTPLVVYGYAFYAQDGDVMDISATGPTGAVFERRIVLEDIKISHFHAYGKRSPSGGWPAGTYKATVVLSRDDEVLAVRHTQVEVTK